MSTSKDGTIEIYYDDVVVCRGLLPGEPYPAGRKLTAWAGDPWHTAAVGYLSDLKYREQSDITSTVSSENAYIGSLGGQVRKHTVLTYTKTLSDYVMQFKLKLTANSNNWGNIVHITADGQNCCNNGQRVPAIWTYHGTTRLHIRTGTSVNGNAGCDPMEPIGINKWREVKIVVNGGAMEVYYDSKMVCRADIGPTYPSGRKAWIWMSDPWHNAAPAYVQDFSFKPYSAAAVPKSNYEEKKFYLPTAFTPYRNHLATFKSPGAFEFSMSFKVDRVVNHWQNLIHFSIDGHDSGALGRRNPAIWIYPNLNRLHVRTGTSVDHNNGCDPAERVALGVWHTFKMTVSPNAVMEVYVDGKLGCRSTLGGTLLPAGRSLIVQGSHDSYNAYYGQIKEISLESYKAYTSSKADASLFIGGEYPLVQNTYIGRTVSTGAFTTSFSIMPKAKLGHWQSVLHVTSDGNNCCANGQRVPAIWLHPHTNRLHVRTGYSTDGNIGCDPWNEVPLNKFTKVEVSLSPSNVMEVYMDGSLVCKSTFYGSKFPAGRSMVVYTTDPWHGHGNGILKDVEITPYVAKQSQSSASFAALGAITMGPRLLGVTRSYSAYKLKFGLYLTAVSPSWGSILHFTTGSNCCHYGQRIPAIWTFGGHNRLHIRSSTTTNGNNGCDPVDQIPLRKWTTIEVSVRADTTMVVKYDGVVKCNYRMGGGPGPANRNMYVYASDPWHGVAQGLVKDIEYSPL